MDEDKIRVRPVYRMKDVTVWSVRGEVVRDDLDVDFVAGGHHHRNRYIPEDEVWVERMMSRRDFALTAAHAVAELYLVRKGMDIGRAHEAAVSIERRLRLATWRNYTTGRPVEKEDKRDKRDAKGDAFGTLPGTDVETICLDFDGVVHSYTSGFQGDEVIPDPPMPGAKEAIRKLREEHDVVIHSTRCATPGGRQAIERWLDEHDIEVDGVDEHKPPAAIYVDDRGLRFEGAWSVVVDQINDILRSGDSL